MFNCDYCIFSGKFKTDTVQGWVGELDRLRKQPGSFPKFSSPHLKHKHTEGSKDSATVRPFSVDHKEKDS